jgi:hypothetical protein
VHVWFFHVDLAVVAGINFGAWHKHRYNNLAATGVITPIG